MHVAIVNEAGRLFKGDVYSRKYGQNMISGGFVYKVRILGGIAMVVRLSSDAISTAECITL